MWKKILFDSILPKLHKEAQGTYITTRRLLKFHHCKMMIFSGLVTLSREQNPPICAKMQQKKPQTPQKRERIALLKADEDMFRHRIESLPGNRPNLKPIRDSGDFKDEDIGTV